MWVRKTNFEVLNTIQTQEESNRRFNVKISSIRFLRAFSISILVLTILALTIDPFPSPYYPNNPISVSELPQYISSILLLSLVIATFRFFISFFMPGYYSSRNPTLTICYSCKHVSKNNRGIECKCGGKFEDLDYYKWREPETTTIPEAEKWIIDYKIMKNEA